MCMLFISDGNHLSFELQFVQKVGMGESGCKFFKAYQVAQHFLDFFVL